MSEISPPRVLPFDITASVTAVSEISLTPCLEQVFVDVVFFSQTTLFLPCLRLTWMLPIHSFISLVPDAKRWRGIGVVPMPCSPFVVVMDAFLAGVVADRSMDACFPCLVIDDGCLTTTLANQIAPLADMLK